MKQPAAYMMSNGYNGVIYTGVTSQLVQRVYQHKHGLLPGFTNRNDCKILVWYELHETIESAILREKQIKGGSRNKKLRLIQLMNPEWRDLYDDLLGKN